MASPWKQLKVKELNNSNQIACYRQILKEEKRQHAARTKELIVLNELRLRSNNSYISNYHSPEKKKTMKMQDTVNMSQGQSYDMCMKDTFATGYNQKSHKSSLHDRHAKPRELPKVALATPLTTANAYGWMTPIDDLRTGFARSGMCQNTFMDKGHL